MYVESRQGQFRERLDVLALPYVVGNTSAVVWPPGVVPRRPRVRQRMCVKDLAEQVPAQA